MTKENQRVEQSTDGNRSQTLINDPTQLVLSALKSITLTNPTTALDTENKVIYLRPDAAKPQVSLVSGGGSGHEPSFAAFVGPGLLSGAVAGTIFASPSGKSTLPGCAESVAEIVGLTQLNKFGDAYWEEWRRAKACS